jgi:multidrug efflux system membrane fusion protein
MDNKTVKEVEFTRTERFQQVQPQLPPEEKKGKGWVWILVLLALAAAGYVGFQRYTQGQAAATKAAAAGSRVRTMPVVAATVRKGNIDVFLTGLGTVTPVYTVTVKSRVDGQLMSVRYKEGDVVHEGDVLMEIDPRPYQVMLEQAEGQMAKDQALLKNSQLDLARYKTLAAQDAIPTQQLDTQVYLVGQYEAAIKVDQSAIDNGRLQLTYARITSPITGRVGLRLVDPGNIVHASDTNGLVVITQLQPITVIFTIAEDQLPPVLAKTRAGATLGVDAYDREMRKKLASGVLQTIDNQIDTTTGTVKLRASFPNQDNSLFPNQFVNARLLVDVKHDVILVPLSAIQRTSATAYSYVVQPNHTVTVKEVGVGITEGETAQVTSGLDPGDIVVTDGVDKLQEGSAVDVRTLDGKTMAPSPDGGSGKAGKGGKGGKGRRSQQQ